jgi:hypothetical protein
MWLAEVDIDAVRKTAKNMFWAEPDKTFGISFAHGQLQEPGLGPAIDCIARIPSVTTS